MWQQLASKDVNSIDSVITVIKRCRYLYNIIIDVHSANFLYQSLLGPISFPLFSDSFIFESSFV